MKRKLKISKKKEENYKRILKNIERIVDMPEASEDEDTIFEMMPSFLMNLVEKKTEKKKNNFLRDDWRDREFQGGVDTIELVTLVKKAITNVEEEFDLELLRSNLYKLLNNLINLDKDPFFFDAQKLINGLEQSDDNEEKITEPFLALSTEITIKKVFGSINCYEEILEQMEDQRAEESLEHLQLMEESDSVLEVLKDKISCLKKTTLDKGEILESVEESLASLEDDLDIEDSIG